MPSRRQFSGNASAQTLTADLTSVAATATISSATGWPNGAVGPFAVVIDRGTNAEEKCLCSGLSGNTLTFQTRGYDGTGGAAHSNGAAVELCLTAVDLDEANAHTSAVAGVHGIAGNVVGTTDSQTLANKTLIQPVIASHVNATHDHTTNDQGGLLGVRTPTGLTLSSPWANAGGGNSLAGYAIDASGRVWLQGIVFCSSVVGAANIATGLPAPADGRSHAFSVVDYNGTAHVLGVSPTGVLSNVVTNFAASAAVGLDSIGYQT
jgi:hypothetical protein